ncbi:MAG: plastocyanin/azurin family copper-binding protein [Gemmatimonadaceae bacterium]
MRGISFDPSELNVTKGAAITFQNNSGVVHDVVFDAPLDPAITNIGVINSGSTTIRTFGTSGTWNFHCTLHGGMVGKVIVP